MGAERYEIQRVVGEGGMGVVLEAHDRQFGRAVAIKQLRRTAAGTPGCSKLAVTSASSWKRFRKLALGATTIC
jgi:serine/threonine protein kinase